MHTSSNGFRNILKHPRVKGVQTGSRRQGWWTVGKGVTGDPYNTVTDIGVLTTVVGVREKAPTVQLQHTARRALYL